MSFVVPAVLPSSRKDLEEKLALVVQIPSVSRVQIDVVDGMFAEPASWPYFAKATNGIPTELEIMVQKGEMLPYLDRIVYEIDLMCIDAERMAQTWLILGATRLTFHAESTTDISRLLAFMCRSYGAGDGFIPGLVSYGVALNVASDLALIEPCLDEVEYVQCMGIARIGRQGQLFDPRVFEKIRAFHTRHPHITLQVDGGVSLENAKRLLMLGVSDLVIGSALFSARDIAATFSKFEALQSNYGV